MVVHGADGMDELSLSGPTTVCELKDGWTTRYELTPEDAGLTAVPSESVAGGDAAENAGILRAVVEGEPGPRRDIVLLNAGAALYISGNAPDIRSGVELAAKSIDSGKAAAALTRLVDVSNSFPREEGSVATAESEMYPPRFLWDVD